MFDDDDGYFVAVTYECTFYRFFLSTLGITTTKNMIGWTRSWKDENMLT
jgi:hypothetical protein